MRYNDAAEGVCGAPEAMLRPALACAVAGCPLAGTISDSTNGGGPWECRFHHFRADGQTADDVTRWIRDTLAEGRPLAPPRGPSQGALALQQKVRSRTPGEDDE